MAITAAEMRFRNRYAQRRRPLSGEPRTTPRPDVDDEPSLASCDQSMGGGDPTPAILWNVASATMTLLEQVGWQDWQHTAMA
ncbi:hypothetical protein B5V03_00035 [Bradyrhizobium betae]|uniref:Uncharacterized protein n=2 Tax=Bradyrhizobium betae TaxID=244734 RepID=A0A4Q1VNU0_9BRAD|nr:hypothetical protein B5V03_00035 [Bradyrhizobium betae]